MKLLKVFSLSFFIFLSFLVTPVFAVVTTTTPFPPKPVNKVSVQGGVSVASVIVSKAKIVSQNNNIFKISFTIVDNTEVQAGVKYGLILSGPISKTYSIADQKVYPESLTLYKGLSVSRDITYEAPNMLSAGTYNLSLSVSNESGFPFGINDLGSVVLKDSPGLNMSQSSCFFQVVGEKDEPHYNPDQQVLDIKKGEILRLTCDASNSTNSDISVTPTFETRYGSAYGELVPQVGGDNTAITFNSNETKTFSVLLPTVSTSQFYDVGLKLSNNNISSNIIKVRYFLQGNLATIINLSLDKDSYKKGDTAVLSFLYNLTQNTAKSNRIKPTDSASGYILKASILSETGIECISPINQKITSQDVNKPKTDISVSINNDCINPKISATLSDNNGNILDQKNYSVTPNKTPVAETTNNYVLIIIAILIGVLLVGGIAFYFKNLKKKQNETEIK